MKADKAGFYKVTFSVENGKGQTTKELQEGEDFDGTIEFLYTELPIQNEELIKNWEQLKKDLYVSPLFSKAFAQANDKAFTLFRAELIDGMNGNGNEVELKVFINMMGLTFTDSEKLELNKMLTDNNFTIQI